MALTKGYKVGAGIEDIKTADASRFTLTGEIRKSNAGRKRTEPTAKKQRFTIAMTNTEHEHLTTLANELTNGSASALIVSLVEEKFKELYK